MKTAAISNAYPQQEAISTAAAANPSPALPAGQKAAQAVAGYSSVTLNHVDAAGERWPYHGDDEIAAVTDILRSGRVNQWNGEHVRQFETEFASYFDAPHALALANGSIALDLALKVLGIGPGDEVIVTPRSFVASVNCVALVGATPVFADVDADSQNITADTIAPLITSRTKAIVPVHLAGWPCDMPAIMALAERHGLVVIEDCAQSHGAEIGGRKAGSFGHAAAFSFCTDKIMSSGGEGGALLLKDEAAWKAAWQFKDHGKSLDELSRPAAHTGFRWLIDAPGTNWRLTEMQAALARLQLTKLEGWLQLRQRNAQIWRDALADVPAIRLPDVPAGTRHAWYKFYAFVRPEMLPDGVTRDTLVKALTDAGLRAFTGSCPEIYLERAFAANHPHRLPVARALGETSLMFELHPTLDPLKLTQRAQQARDIILSATGK